MLLAFWKNPEFIRHLRANLRPGRMGAAVAVTAIVCALAGVGFHDSIFDGKNAGILIATDTQKLWKDFAQAYFNFFFIMQTALLVIWTAGACFGSVSGEREKKTFDFLRTTSLSPAELMVGKLFGAPVVGWFIYALTLPVTFIAGVFAGHDPGTLLLAYLLTILFTCMAGLAAMTGSLQIERVGAGTVAVVVFGFYLFGIMGMALTENSPFPGLACLTLYPALMNLLGPTAINTSGMKLFGTPVHTAIVSTIIYASISAWFILAIVRNMKREFEEVRLFNRWQALGFILYVNLIFFALFDPKFHNRYGNENNWTGEDLMFVALGMNILMTGLIGLNMIAPAAQLRVWWREWKKGRAHYFSDNGPVWPWLLLSVVPGIICTGAYVLGSSELGPLAKWPFARAGMILLVFTVFQLRDILFLEVCVLTKMKRAIAAGAFFLMLYYGGSSIIAIAVGVRNDPAQNAMFELLTPFDVFRPEAKLLAFAPITGLAIQIIVSGLLVMASNKMLARKAHTPGSAVEAA